jgi:hypothetical protein
MTLAQTIDRSHSSASGRRRLVFAIVAVALAVCLPLAMLLGVDVYLHHKYYGTAGYNVWGYRGPTVGRKAPNEYRAAILGGSAAFGYGGNWDEAISAVLERNLAGRRVGRFDKISIVNLAYNNEGAYSFKFTMQDYLWLKYDMVILYEGYNDLVGDPKGPNVQVFRHESPVFRLTGYLPIFPIIFREKATILLTNGDVNVAYGHEPTKTVFHPGLAKQTAAETLKAAADIGEQLDRQIGRVVSEPRPHIDDPAGTGCKSPWQQYCRSYADAIDFALAHHVQVIAAGQPHGVGPYFRERHIEQQTELAAMIARRYGRQPNVRYVNFGDTVSTADPALSYDRMHLTNEGNRRMAAAFMTPVLELAALRAADRP